MSDEEKYDLEEIATTWTELNSKLSSGEGLPQLPFWLTIGGTGFRVTEENRETLALGMLLGLTSRLEGFTR